MPYLRQADLSKYLSESTPTNTANNDGQWVSVSEDVEFMPNTNLPPLPRPPKIRKLETEDGEEEEGSTTGAWEEHNPYSVQPFVEGMSEYDEYQQAWRLLGFMIDCNSADDDGSGSHSGSGSEDTTEDGCARYVLWAAVSNLENQSLKAPKCDRPSFAFYFFFSISKLIHYALFSVLQYVDLDYEGGGIGEYQYWDRDTQAWNDTSCYYGEGGDGNNNDDAEEGKSRCAKMDCHLDSTSFSVLGFFKHRNYDDWMEQLFKHEGMCVWSEEEYAFMKNARKAWPQGCVDSGTMTDDGKYNLYYNIQPQKNGRIGVGLYTDTECLVDYSVTTDEMEDIIGNMFVDGGGSGSQDENYDFSSDSLSDSMDRWHSAFDVWHTCHPCVAYDIENLDGTKYYSNGDDYYNRRELGGEYSAQGETFECYDDAGYTNVNQCMKFSAKTTMQTATFRDLSLGRTQATLVEYPLSGFFEETDHYRLNTRSNIKTYFCLSAAVMGFLYSLINLYGVSKVAKRQRRRDRRKRASSHLLE